MDSKKVYVQKRLVHIFQKNDNHSRFHSQHNWGGVGWGELIPFIEHPKLALNQPEIEWSPLPTLYGGSRGQYAVVLLMKPKHITP